jgi:hypothetical protein
MPFFDVPASEPETERLLKEARKYAPHLNDQQIMQNALLHQADTADAAGLDRVLREIADETGYPPTAAEIHEWVEIAKMWPELEDRKHAEWEVYRLVYRLWGKEAKRVMTIYVAEENGRSGLVTEAAVREAFRLHFGEERGYLWPR